MPCAAQQFPPILDPFRAPPTEAELARRRRSSLTAEQAAMLMRAGDVKRLLLLNATSRGDTLDDVVRS